MIDLSTVITASHCILGSVENWTYKVYLGLQDVNQVYKGKWPVYLASKAIKVMICFFFNYFEFECQYELFNDSKFNLKHPSFNPKTLQNDIAILKLAQPVTLSKTVQVACLPTTDSSLNYPSIDSTAYVMGNSFHSFLKLFFLPSLISLIFKQRVGNNSI